MTRTVLAHSLLTHLTCVKLFKDFQSLSRIAHCNWNSGVSHAICHWSSHEALPFHPVITCITIGVIRSNWDCSCKLLQEVHKVIYTRA